jgi:hypothetical protein
VSEQETRQESFLLQDQETAQECFPPLGQKAVQEILLPQGGESIASSACGFFAASKIGAIVNQGAGDLASRNFLLFFVATKKFVALDGGNHADRAFLSRLGALHAAEAADAYGSGQSDLVGKGQKNLHGRAFPDILRKEEVDTAGTDVP